MKTIDELIPDNFVQDGTFKITRTSWHSRSYFLPFFKSDNEWFGLDRADQYLRYGTEGSTWEMFKNKPNKVTYEAWFDSKNETHKLVMMYPQGTTMRDGWVKLPGSIIVPEKA